MRDDGGGGAGTLGIDVPAGDAGALAAAAGDLRGGSGVLDRVAHSVRDDACVAGWSGTAALSFQGAAVGQAGSAATGAGALTAAASLVAELGQALVHATRVAERAVADALDAKARGDRARADAAAAASAARLHAAAAQAAGDRASALQATGHPAPAEVAAREQAAGAARDAHARAGAASSAAAAADEDLQAARRRGNEATDHYRDLARQTAGKIAALADMAPDVLGVNGVPVASIGGPGRPPGIAPLPPPAPAEEDKDDGGGGIMGWVHGGLDVAGFVPVVGALADGANGLIYVAEGDYVNAGLSAGAAVPFVGDAAAGAKLAYKGAKAIEAADDVADTARAGRTLLEGGQAADGSFVPAVLDGDALPLSARPQPGQRIHRVYGQPADGHGPIPMEPNDFSGPAGRSWTPTDPAHMPNPRDHLGLPDVNAGRFVVEGRIIDAKAIVVRRALPLDGTRGGGLEYLIPDPTGQIRIVSVRGISPPL